MTLLVGITAFLIVAAVAMFILLIMIADDLIRVDKTYSSRADAEADNVFARGEMPLDMPTTMQEIEIRTHVEFNYAWSKFVVDDKGVREIRANFPRISPDQVNLPIRPGVGWWPKDLRPDSTLHETEYEFYRCGERVEFTGSAFLALDPKINHVYYWLK